MTPLIARSSSPDGPSPDHGLQFAVRRQPVAAAVAPDATLLEATERRLGMAADRVDAHVAGTQPRREAQGSGRVRREDVVVEAVVAVVGQSDGLLLVVERDDDHDRPEDL